MSIILIVSIIIRVLALSWSIVLLRRIRDWRVALLTAMIALMAVRQTWTLLKTPDPFPISFTANIDELPGLAVSVLAFLALLFLGRMILEGRKDNFHLQKRSVELQESEARFSRAAELAKIGYWVWDEVEDKAIYCSEGLAKN